MSKPTHRLAALFVSAAALFAVGSASAAFTADSYAGAESLVACYDGIYNTTNAQGELVHEEAPSLWYDITGHGYDAVPNANVVWVEDHWENSADGQPMTTPAALGVDHFTDGTLTVEFCAMPARHNARATFVGQYNGSGYGIEHIATSGGMRIWIDGNPDAKSSVSLVTSETGTISVASTPTSIQVYKNGSLGYSSSGGPGLPDPRAYVIGGEPQRGNMALRGSFYACRFFDRVLTPEEIAYNAALDAARFSGQGVTTAFFTVSGTPHMFNPPGGNIRYGQFPVTAGEVLSTHVAAAFNNGKYKCLGYELYKLQGGTFAKVADKTDTSYTVKKEDVGGVFKLIWKWDVQCKYTSASYLQNEHLIAQWDAYENAVDANGKPCHADAPDVWTELVKGVEVTQSGTLKHSDFGVDFNGSAYFSAAIPEVLTALTKKNLTIQMTIKITGTSSAGGILHIGNAANIRELILEQRGSVFGSLQYAATSWTGLATISGTAGFLDQDIQLTITVDSAGAHIYCNDMPLHTNVGSGLVPTSDQVNIGLNIGSGSAKFTLRSIRFYDCVLTEADMAENERIDRIRFWNEGDAGASFVVACEPSWACKDAVECGQISVEPGDELEVPAMVETNNGRILCRGWKLYAVTSDGACEPIEGAAGAGDGNAYKVTEDDVGVGRKLVWQWEPQFKYDVDAYVSRGLVANWDGYYHTTNALGQLVHDQDSKVWRDVKGGLEFTLFGMVEHSDLSLYFDGVLNNYGRILSTAPGFSQAFFSGEKTVEVVLKPSGTARSVVLKGPSAYHLAFGLDGNTAIVCSGDGYANKVYAGAVPKDRITTYATVYDSDNAAVGFNFCGAAALTGSTATFGYSNNSADLGKRVDQNDIPYFGRIYAIRVYDRMLSEDEVSYNRVMDEVRFCGASETNLAIVTGEPRRFNDNSKTVAYGVLPVAAGVVFEAPAEVVFDGGKAVCKGWRLYRVNANGECTLIRKGVGRRFETTADDVAGLMKLAWQWEEHASITISGGEAGMVALNGGAPGAQASGIFPIGTRVTVALTPAVESGYAYDLIGGGDCETDASGKAFSFIVDGPNDALSVLSRKLFYVKTDDADAVETIREAYIAATTALEEGTIAAAEILLAKGTYPETDFILDRPIAVVGATGNPAEVEIVDEVAGNRAFKLSHAEAKVANLTISGSGYHYGSGGIGGHVVITDGLVRNCVIRGGQCSADGSNKSGQGGNVYMSGGRITHSRITNGRATASLANAGIGVYATGSAIVDNCLIDHNASVGEGVVNGGGVCLANGAKLVSCTVVSNANGGVRIVSAPSAVLSTVIFNNGDTLESELGAANLRYYDRCASSVENAEDLHGCVVSWRDFKGYAQWLQTDNAAMLRPAYGGKLVNSGFDRKDCSFVDGISATDLLGNPRFSGKRMDIGSIEGNFAGMVFRVK